MALNTTYHGEVSITQAQATALEVARATGYDYEIVKKHSDDYAEWGDEYKALNELSLNTLINALYIGYEVELTPEEQLKEWYSSIDPGSKQIVEIALNKLEVQVKGVNK